MGGRRPVRTASRWLAAVTVALALAAGGGPALADDPGNGGGGTGGSGGGATGGGNSPGDAGGAGGGDNGPGGYAGGGSGGQAPTGPQGAVGGAESGSVDLGDCSLFANQHSFGGDCASSGSGGGKTFRELLGNDPFPKCRYSQLPEGFPQPRAPKGQSGGRWVVETCLGNVTVDGPGPGGVQRQTRLFYLGVGKEMPQLTAGQLAVWNSLATEYPTPFLLTGPVDPPRVNTFTTFWVGVTGEDAGRAAREDVTDGGKTFSSLVMHAVAPDGTPLRAFISVTRVWPGVDDGERPVECPGGGISRNDAKTPVGPQECAFTYAQSSAHLAGDEYQLTLEADWKVQYQQGGQWLDLGQAPITSVYRTKVEEIQTVNH